jgi:hypothetical protein
MTARQGLVDNQSEDIAALIDEALRRIVGKRKTSRRNWWDTLAGGKDGRPMVREGITFPVLRVAQIRQGNPSRPTQYRETTTNNRLMFFLRIAGPDADCLQKLNGPPRR